MGEIVRREEKRAKNPQMTSKGTGILKENGYIREKRKEAERKGETREKEQKISLQR